jgi:phosphohistidine phosphatase
MPHEKIKSFHQSPEQSREVYLMRHGAAADRDSTGSTDDSKRPLTPEGKLKLRAITKGLSRIGVELDWIVSSPLTRAVETAKVVAEELAPSAVLDQCEALAPSGGSVQKIMGFLAQHQERTRVLLAGHEPSLSKFASELIGAGQAANLAFKKGGCALITLEGFQPPGLLVWWLTPRVLRKLGS